MHHLLRASELDEEAEGEAETTIQDFIRQLDDLNTQRNIVIHARYHKTRLFNTTPGSPRVNKNGLKVPYERIDSYYVQEARNQCEGLVSMFNEICESLGESKTSSPSDSC